MFIVFAICVPLLLAPQSVFSDDSPPYSDTATSVLYNPVNDSLTEIRLVLDDTQKSIHEKQQLYIPVLVEMNRSIGDQGPFDSHLAISPKIYTRFVVFIDEISTQVAIQMTNLYLDAINLIEKALHSFLKPTRAARTVKLLKFVIYDIAPKIGKVTADNKSRYWAIYEWVAVRLVRLQTQGSPSDDEYEARLEYVLAYGVANVNRYINEVGNLVDQFAADVADKLYDVLREALDPRVKRVGSTVEPWVDDKLEL